MVPNPDNPAQQATMFAAAQAPEKFCNPVKQDLAQWLKIFNHCCTFNGWLEDAKKIAVLPMFLEGEAFVYYEEIMASEEKPTTFELLKEELMNKCFTNSRRDNYLDAFYNRDKKPDETLHAYLHALRTNLEYGLPMVKRHASNEFERLLKRRFFTGLPENLRSKLFGMRSRVITALDLLSAAQEVEADYASNPFKPSTPRQITSAVSAIENINSRRDRIQTALSTNANKSPNYRKRPTPILKNEKGEMLCWYCQSSEHLHRDCPEKGIRRQRSDSRVTFNSSARELPENDARRVINIQNRLN